MMEKERTPIHIIISIAIPAALAVFVWVSITAQIIRTQTYTHEPSGSVFEGLWIGAWTDDDSPRQQQPAHCTLYIDDYGHLLGTLSYRHPYHLVHLFGEIAEDDTLTGGYAVANSTRYVAGKLDIDASWHLVGVLTLSDDTHVLTNATLDLKLQ